MWIVIDAGTVEGPSITNAGEMISVTGGHGDAGNGLAEEFAEAVHAHEINLCDGPDEVRKATRAEIKAGAAVIKVMATGGVLTPGVSPTQTALLPEELAVVAQEAHNSGRRVTTHAIGRSGIHNALVSGIDSIEHGFYLDDELLDIAVAQGTYVRPLESAVESAVESAGESTASDVANSPS